MEKITDTNDPTDLAESPNAPAQEEKNEAEGEKKQD
jgi:hypothetical protein